MQTNPISEKTTFEPEAVASETTLGLLSDLSCLQNAILVEQLQEKLEIPCKLITPEEIEGCSLLLHDCNAFDPEHIKTVLQSANDCPLPPTSALINAVAYGPHESLIHWSGLNGIFYISTDQRQLIMGIREILRGDYWLPRRLLYHFLERNRRIPDLRATEVKLTRREKQILQCMQQGATNAEISASLFVSEHTIKSHLYNIFKKLGVKNRLEACNWARNFL